MLYFAGPAGIWSKFLPYLIHTLKLFRLKLRSKEDKKTAINESQYGGVTVYACSISTSYLQVRSRKHNHVVLPPSRTFIPDY